MGGFNNYNGNVNGGAPQEKKKSNFRVGKIYGSDGTLDVSVWNSDKGGVYGILSIKSVVGKDPSTGGNVYEQKMSGELPSIFMNADILRALVMGVKGKDPSTINVMIDTKRGSKMTIKGQSSVITLTIDNQKTGTRTINIPAISIGDTSVHASWENLVSYLNVCLKKAMTCKLDPEEFGLALAADSSEGENSAEDSPF